ncbi:hypothetical protein G7B22_13365 [Blautia sp. MSK.20.9]|jgi:hypothetical protein|nr:hypothetical protein [Blautia sp. MSK.20.9]
MIIYSRFRLFLSCLLCAAGADPGRSARTAEKVCSILDPLYNRPIWLFNGRLDSGRRSIALSVLRALWAKIERQLLTTRKSRHRSADDPQPFAGLVIPIVKQTIFLAVLEYLKYSDTEKARKMAEKRTAQK